MNSQWFTLLQRAFAAASVLLRYSRGVSRLLSCWLLLDEKREAERHPIPPQQYLLGAPETGRRNSTIFLTLLFQLDWFAVRCERRGRELG